MTPSEVRDATLAQLRAVRTKMLSEEWTESLQGKDQKTQEEAAKAFLRAHHAIQQLENGELAKIRDELVKNEKDLLAGTAKLGKALKNLNRVKSVLQTLGSVLDVVAKVVPLLL